MLEIAISIIDRLISLFKQREENDRKLFENFVVPITDSLDKLHQDYLDSFDGYRAAICSSNISLDTNHPILLQIRKDALYKAQLRAKLEILSGYEDDPVFSNLVKAVARYISIGMSSRDTLLDGYTESTGANYARSYLLNGLTNIFSSDIPNSRKSTCAVKVLDEVVGELQLYYIGFQKAVDIIKRQLLDRRI